MNEQATIVAQRPRPSLGRQLHHAEWELLRAGRAFGRRFGAAGWVLIFAALVAGAACLVQQRETRLGREVQQQLQASRQAAGRSPVPVKADDHAAIDESRKRLAQFELLLLPPGEIPLVLQDLLRLAEAQGLDLQRGEYQPQPDAAAGFMRYRMNLPVKGQSLAIYRFIALALSEQPALALESVRFLRAQVDSDEVEARIQWVLLTKLPGEAEPVSNTLRQPAKVSP